MTRTIDKLYKRSFTDAYFFGYVYSLQKNLPTCSIKKSVRNFMNAHQLTDDDVNEITLISTYSRMNSEYRETLKTKKDVKE
jgi:hypothetical protein